MADNDLIVNITDIVIQQTINKKVDGVGTVASGKGAVVEGVCAGLGEGGVAPLEWGLADGSVDNETIGRIKCEVESIDGIAPINARNGVVIGTRMVKKMSVPKEWFSTDGSVKGDLVAVAQLDV